MGQNFELSHLIRIQTNFYYDIDPKTDFLKSTTESHLNFMHFLIIISLNVAINYR
jgi:hypothetical protein